MNVKVVYSQKNMFQYEVGNACCKSRVLTNALLSAAFQENIKLLLLSASAIHM
jgi:hypothetical protein